MIEFIQRVIAYAVVFAVLVPATTLAQPSAVGAEETQVGQNAPGSMVDGEIRKINVDTGKVTIRHGAIAHLDMPPMTMVFGVREPALLDQIKPGDKVRFRVISENRKFVVTEIQVVN